MKSKRSHEGYLLIDHRNSPGLTDAETHAGGLPAGSGRGMFEAPTITCSHCQTTLIVNPLRNRERGYCRKCDHYICDQCGVVLAATGICKPFKRYVDEQQELADKGQGGIIL